MDDLTVEIVEFECESFRKQNQRPTLNSSNPPSLLFLLVHLLRAVPSRYLWNVKHAKKKYKKLMLVYHTDKKNWKTQESKELYTKWTIILIAASEWLNKLYVPLQIRPFQHFLLNSQVELQTLEKYTKEIENLEKIGVSHFQCMQKSFALKQTRQIVKRAISKYRKFILIHAVHRKGICLF